MRFALLSFCALLLLSACESTSSSSNIVSTGPAGSGYWRPISAPNVLMETTEAQAKLEYDLSQCLCGVLPRNIPTPVMMQYNPDQQRMMETSRGGHCESPNQYVLAECMRARGWEPTLCAGRLPVGSGGGGSGFCGQP